MAAFRIQVAFELNSRYLITLGLLLAGWSHAEELAIEAMPFEVVHTLDAKVVPQGEVPLIKIDAKAWQTFTITQLAAHGSRVNKGDVLFAADTREIDQKLESLKREIATSELTIADTQDALAKLEETADRRLAAAKREAAEARELLEYFTSAGRKAEEDEARQSIKRSESDQGPAVLIDRRPRQRSQSAHRSRRRPRTLRIQGNRRWHLLPWCYHGQPLGDRRPPARPAGGWQCSTPYCLCQPCSGEC